MSRIAAVVLAAGTSSRMGRPKALLDIGGQPLIRRLVETALQQNIQPIIVTGHQPEQVQAALHNCAVTFAHNPDFEAGGMLSSVKVGCRAVQNHFSAFFLMLLDQPLVRANTLLQLSQAWLEHQPPIAVPQNVNQHGHPILIASTCIAEILSLPAQATLRDFVAQHRPQTRIVDVGDPGVLTDVDTPEDYQRILGLWRGATRHD